MARVPTLPGIACIWIRHPRNRDTRALDPARWGPVYAPLGEIHSTFLSDTADWRFG